MTSSPTLWPACSAGGWRRRCQQRPRNRPAGQEEGGRGAGRERHGGTEGFVPPPDSRGA